MKNDKSDPDKTAQTRFRYTWHDEILKADLPDGAKALAGFLFQRCSKYKNECYPSQETMALGCLATVRSIQRRLEKLRARGWIEVVKRAGPRCKSGNHVDRYRLLIPGHHATVVSGGATVHQATNRAENESHQATNRADHTTAASCRTTHIEQPNTMYTFLPHHTTKVCCKQPIGNPSPQPHSTPPPTVDHRGGGGGAFTKRGGRKKPWLKRVTKEELISDEALTKRYAEAIGLKLVQRSEQTYFDFFAAAEHALRTGKNPASLFAFNISMGRHTKTITNADEAAAQNRIRAARHAV